MSSYALTKNTSSYKEAVKVTEQIESPAIRFTRPSDFQGPTSESTAIIKQNNTQRQLLVQIAESPSEKPKEGRGKLHVFIDPYKILKKEQEKLKS
ncbi:hypothetical protein ZIOFF_005711 [Zingiber officinale]|uniref:Uncharacterized protein n=1 Tax=Zingiber officinale TaxID=94328 RepID=A0A8J5I1Q3_ZINOF|nr:hypothetical protein ZIOFF_005711 [Zingiber officinale]